MRHRGRQPLKVVPAASLCSSLLEMPKDEALHFLAMHYCAISEPGDGPEVDSEQGCMAGRCPLVATRLTPEP